MSRMKSLFAVLILVAGAGFVPQAHAAGPIFKIVIAGSSAMWQSQALAAYKAGACVAGGSGGCAHYTAKNFSLNDTRPPLKGGTTQTDKNTVWIVWDHVTTDPNCATTCNVWAYIKVDSVVGDRCYFAHPRCNINVSPFPAPGSQISSTLWGDDSADSTPPLTIQAKFTASSGVLVSAAATDIRPEDGLFATCRANSVIGGGPDGLAGLGYGVNPSGACPTVNDLAHLQGADIITGLTGSTATAHVLDFNISGTDPFSGKAIPAYTTVSVGAAPIVFITERDHELATATGATDAGLQRIFSGANCDASEVGAPAGPIAVYLREPLSGTMNTTEYTVFRYPNFSGASQETGVAATNPLIAKPCTVGGARWRAVGTGDEVTSVQNSFTNNSHDGIGYTFFSYGNVGAIANQTKYGYLTLNGVDPIFHKYGSTIDPGQPASPGVLPAAANLPATCAGGAGNFPCAENKIWSGGLSFPNLRSGQYRAWSTLRLVSDGAALAVAKLLAAGGNTFVQSTVPDYVPFLQVGTLDPGLVLVRSHYTQEGIAPINDSITGDKGGDAGGCILHATPGGAPTAIAETDSTVNLGQALPGNECVSLP